MTRPLFVLDTNIVLDVFVFADGSSQALRAGLEQDALRWIASQAMRDELQRVLGYPQIARRFADGVLAPHDVLAAFDRHVHLKPDAPKAPVTCGDADDQKFIDLAVAHGAALLSKDFEVLRMRKRLLALGVVVQSALPAGDAVTASP